MRECADWTISIQPDKGRFCRLEGDERVKVRIKSPSRDILRDYSCFTTGIGNSLCVKCTGAIHWINNPIRGRMLTGLDYKIAYSVGTGFESIKKLYIFNRHVG